jgi:acetyl esterase/lipase
MATYPSIKVTSYDDLSVLYKVLRTVIRPFRPRLVKPGKPLPLGSPKLSPPHAKCATSERQVEGIFLHDFLPTSPSPSSSLQNRSGRHHLFYFAGGGFQSPPSSDHWKFCAELAVQLNDLYDVTVVSYPLAPNSPAPQSLPALRNWLRTTVSDAASNDCSVTLMGDSSGGTIALSLGIWCASNISEHTLRSTLKNIFVISPATDLRNENAAIVEADKHDPVLSIRLTSELGKTWAGSMPLDHQEVSPIFSDLNLCRLADVKVHGVVGTHDVLAPDALKFRDACNQAGVVGEWLEWRGQMHCFPLAFAYGLKEGKQGKDWILDVLRRNV